MSMKAVTGRPGNETPMLISQINSIVLNPPWNVPSSIATKELWPKEKEGGPGYLKRNGFRVIDTGDGGKRLQQSSEKSALGKFKFDFPNDFAVYLHDTPAQAGFSRFDRLASHGCVRLERPDDLAKLLMQTTPEWPSDKIDATVAAGKTVRAPMAQPVSVYLLYWTAFAGQTGPVAFREDPYGWDGDLAARIERRSAAQTQLASRWSDGGRIGHEEGSAGRRGGGAVARGLFALRARQGAGNERGGGECRTGRRAQRAARRRCR
ncbi:L,D-transpeptidase family protein [Sphingomonas sp. MMS24-JH45]